MSAASAPSFNSHWDPYTYRSGSPRGGREVAQVLPRGAPHSSIQVFDTAAGGEAGSPQDADQHEQVTGRWEQHASGAWGSTSMQMSGR